MGVKMVFKCKIYSLKKDKIKYFYNENIINII